MVPLLLIAVACSNTVADPASTPIPTVPSPAAVPTYIPPTPAPPFTPMPPATASAGQPSLAATISVEATRAAEMSETTIASLEASLVSARATASAPTPEPVVQEISAEELDMWMCLERISGTGTNPPEKIAGVTIVVEGVYWVAFDCGRFVK